MDAVMVVVVVGDLTLERCNSSCYSSLRLKDQNLLYTVRQFCSHDAELARFGVQQPADRHDHSGTIHGVCGRYNNNNNNASFDYC